MTQFERKLKACFKQNGRWEAENDPIYYTNLDITPCCGRAVVPSPSTFCMSPIRAGQGWTTVSEGAFCIPTLGGKSCLPPSPEGPKEGLPCSLGAGWLLAASPVCSTLRSLLVEEWKWNSQTKLPWSLPKHPWSFLLFSTAQGEMALSSKLMFREYIWFIHIEETVS